jgi:hypothetical protein
MTKEEKRIKILELLGWTNLKKTNFGALRGTCPKGMKNSIAPNPLKNLNVIQEVKIKTITTLELRVKWIGHLRDIVSLRMPKNKVGSPITNDVDLHFATYEENIDALLKTLTKSKNK